MNKRKKVWIIIITIILVLAIPNPTESDFKNYLEAKDFPNRSIGRTGYFLIFSIYEVNLPYDYTKPHQTYIGIFKNFIYIK
jgi:hypothetical protein